MANILIADDDDILVDMIAHRLRSAGHTVTAAADGEEALQMVGHAKPDLIVLDSMMPVLSGMEVLTALSQQSDMVNIPVLFLSARKGENDIVSALAAGASDYLTKPFIPQELLTRITVQLKRRGGFAEPSN
ncbi:response regulator [Altererythrobacter confluentis]|uniref:Response regulator n=1 Tax=Allopontixanthobacter confluentis TaxID=1849021 RepID=A0A6L7GDP9_9SPHN|nr:response regulator transcription factor [Allopontixanthobacter confluentis]MXP13615.1 response regulator [Allopontixanthobacter confluentis]